ncbi:protein MAIN-LIKE 1-like [Vicia villosa]|uniref:protein MAIN-LIKE 1-like n=1 Tax=Vicia villosa TaxID=3911 RepID=UPI00273B945D|nr:protein MAIN-LIKE 1-like [Vicia villosa]
MAFVERWHPETSSFHIPHGEITITLYEIACLMHLPIRGILLSHGRLTNEAMEMLIEKLEADPADALEEMERTRGAHVRFHTLQQIYDEELLATHQAAGDEAEADIHREWVLRCYLLYLIGTQLFVDTSSTYIDVVYLTYLSDIARVHEYNLGAAILAYTYHILGKGSLWKARTVVGSCTLLVGEVSGYTEDMSHARVFTSLRGNQMSNSYRRYLDCMAAEDIHYECYADHCEKVPFDEIALYSGWLASSLTIIVRYLPERVIRHDPPTAR